MALTTVTIPAATIRKYAFGSNASQTIRFQSDESLTGKVIQVRIAPYIENPAIPPTAGNQQYAYAVSYPASPMTVNVPALGTLPPSARRFKVMLNYVSEFEYDIIVYWLFTADIDAFPTNSVYNNLHQLEKNNIGAINNLENITPSIYNEVNTFRVESTVWDGTTAYNAVFDQTYKARFLCETGSCATCLDDCVQLPILSWSNILERGGNVVTNLSAYDNTTIKFRAELDPATTISKYWVAIFRRDDYDNTQPYWQDLSLHYAKVEANTLSAVPFSPFPITAFVSATDFTLLGSNIYEASIELDASYFELGGSYRIMIIAEDDTTGQQFSCTHSRALLANDLPPPISGDTDTNIYFFDSASTEYNTDYMIGAATRQRIKIVATMDKVSYNDANFNAGNLGDFNTNLLSVDAVVLDHLPTDTEILNDIQIPLIGYEPDANTSALETTFRIPEEWSNEIRYVIFIWKFKITTGSGFTYNDEIRLPVKLFMQANDEVATNYFLPEFTDFEDELIERRICDDYDEVLNICWTEALETDFDFIPIIQEGDQSANIFDQYKEYNFYDNDNLPELTTPEYLDAEIDTAGDGEACATIEPTELRLNVPIKLGGIFIQKDVVIPPPVCNDIDFESTIVVLLTTNNSTKTILSYDLSPLVNGDVASVELIASWEGQIDVFNSTNATFQTTYVLNGGGAYNWLNIECTIVITLTDGCTYYHEYGFSLPNEEIASETYNAVISGS